MFSEEKSIFLNNIRSINENLLSQSDSRIPETFLFGISLLFGISFLFGISSFNDTKNTSSLNTAIDYVLLTKRFDVPLLICFKLSQH